MAPARQLGQPFDQRVGQEEETGGDVDLDGVSAAETFGGDVDHLVGGQDVVGAHVVV